MKHGDKAKRKASKASGKKSGVKTQVVKAKSGSKAEKSTAPSGGNGKAHGRASSADTSFTNPAVAAAFKRAVRKYPNAFRKLTD
ncbi:MAG TPA: hypothetical protein VLU46_13285 [Thermoanaerobaculia bacterium]|nr:hypothetical protein [Thermoanaerobaculia bacterium]